MLAFDIYIALSENIALQDISYAIISSHLLMTTKKIIKFGTFSIMAPNILLFTMLFSEKV